jgi:PPK2 family polyphosphate:nucleotide phosphotransferase
MAKNREVGEVAITVRPGSKIRLREIDPKHKPKLQKAEAKRRTAQDAETINELQDRLFAERTRSLLVVLQGVDTSGKDGSIRAVFNSTGPLGVEVTPFGQPSREELAHDFLWRVHKAAPGKGKIGIFNRSHYEDVLIVKVKQLAPAAEIEKRYDQINRFEQHLVENGTTILKFMLHISREEQRKRFQERLLDPNKQWKFDPADLEVGKLWDQYQSAYETMLNRCSTSFAPWHVIPADRNWSRNLAVAQLVRRTLEMMNPQYPKPKWNPAEIKFD